MSLYQVRNLIGKLPTKFAAFTAPANLDELKQFKPTEYIEPAKKVLDLFKESHEFDLSGDEREALRRRLKYVAGIIQRIIDLYDLNGHCNAKADALKKLEQVFEDMASALGVSPQVLQNATLSRA